MKKKIPIILVCLLVCSLFLQLLPHGVQATVNPTSAGLTEFAVNASQSGWGYVYATYGQIITQALIDGKARQYPSVYAEIMSDGRTAYQHAQEWIGHRAADCVGLMKAYLWWQGDTASPTYTAAQDKSANGLYYSATIQGPISTIPEIHGLLVWRSGHIGVYIGDGWVIEARGVEYGVVKTRLSDRNWTNWCKHPNLSYPDNGWVVIAGQKAYYRNGSYLSGLQEIDGLTYLFGPDGFLMTGFYLVNGQMRYFTLDGSQLTGWQTIGGCKYYLGGDGVVWTGLQTIDGLNYLFGPTGILLTGWQEVGEDLHYLDPNGILLSGLQMIDGRQFDFSPAGTLRSGWQQMASGLSYYNLQGEKLVGLQLIGGSAYLFDEDGFRQTGWQTTGSLKYYFDPETGASPGDGLQTIESHPMLFQPALSLNQSAGIFYSNNQIYFSDEAGLAQTGQQAVTASLALPAPAEGAEAAALETMPVNLDFGEDYRLLMANQNEFNLDKTQVTLVGQAEASQTCQLTLTGQLPDAEPEAAVVWFSLDPGVASADSSGLVTAAGPGQTLIIARTADGSYASALITVLPDPAALNPDNLTLVMEPGRSADLAIDGLAASLLSACTLSSSNPEIATVDARGRLSAHRTGTADITLSYGGALVLTQPVRVEKPLIGLSASRPTLIIPIGAQAATFASLVPASGSLAAISYSSSDPAVARIGTDGTVTGVAHGSAVLTAQCEKFQVTCQVTVNGNYPTLKPGSSNASVLALQRRLNELGYLAGPNDGIYGPLTEFAVNCFQQKLGLPLTGQTNNSLQLALQADGAPLAGPLITAGTLQPGDSSEAVWVLQQRLFELNYLKCYPDGSFGDLTLQALQTMQVLNGLAPAAQADLNTISRLYSRLVKAGKTTIVPGDSGYEVLQLQTRLKALKYYAGALDSQFTSEVEQAVLLFQIQTGLAADGEAGPKTQRRLFASDAPEAPAYLPTLRDGSTGTAVTDLENRLVALGYHYAEANSAYDSLTVNSVKAFQRRAGLGVTGLADHTTQVRLAASQAPRSIISFRYGSSGDAVKRIQTRLNQLGFSCGTADGRFGSRTTYAVKNFQRNNFLTVDGIVGSTTLARLFAPTEPVAPAAVQPDPVVPAEPAVTADLPELKPGSAGAAVMNLETRLVALGYHYGLADSTYDALTASSVKAFQRRAGLTMTGVADQITQVRLAASSAPRSIASYRYGSSGDAVRRIQLRLNQLGFICGTADSRFGSLTASAAKSFQRKAGLIVDGIVGNGTLSRLFDTLAPTAR